MPQHAPAAAIEPGFQGDTTMHTVLVILAGVALLGLCLLAARGWRGPGAAASIAAIQAFLPLWLIGAALNLYVGVAQAGYSVAEELPIFLVVYAVPAALAAVLWWRLARR